MSGAREALRFDASELDGSPSGRAAFVEPGELTAWRARKLTYRADLDGLRAVAILPVVLFRLGSTAYRAASSVTTSSSSSQGS